MRRPVRFALVLLIAGLVPAIALRAQQAAGTQPRRVPEAAASKDRPAAPADPIVEKIKEEGLKRSQVMRTLSYLTDVIGPRLTGSPNLKRANEWTRDRLSAWGLANARLEAWGPFGRGWSLKRFSAQVIEPQCIPIIAYPKAWSPGTDGVLTGEVVYFDAKTEADFARFKGHLRGAIVLTAPPREVAAHFEPLGTRRTDSDLLELADAPEPAARGGRGGRRFQRTDERRERQSQIELAVKKLNFLADEGVGMLVDPSFRGDGGTLFVQSASIPGLMPNFGGQGQPAQRRAQVYDKDAPKTPPQMVMANEHYNRLVRMIEQGERPKMVVDLAVQFHDDDPMAYNTVAEIPGTDPKLKDEVVMLGGHMDSWHGGTGATDNAAGVSVAMEALRILQATGLKPRRTIRIGLWTGEEQGLLGSRAFVTKHFGLAPPGMGGASTADEPSREKTPEYEKFQAYFNLDNGTGKIRGVYLQGNEAVAPTFRRWLQPFREMGAATLSLSNTGGTDHLSFDAIGLPGFQFIQDEIEYETRTHHSNQDVFDRIQANDMKQASVILATFIYRAAAMDEKLPRKPWAAPAGGRRRVASSD